MSEERTEQATPRRREEARRRGEIPRSAELAGALALVGSLLGLRLDWNGAVAAAAGAVRRGLYACAEWNGTATSAADAIRAAAAAGARMAGPAALCACAAAVAANLAQSGFIITGHGLAPRWSRVSISAGLRRVFSAAGAFSVLRSVLKVAAVAAVGFHFVRGRWDDILALAQGTPAGAGVAAGGLLWMLLTRAAAALLVVAAADYVFQRRQHERGLRMTRYELKEEYRRTEGDPHVRARLRELQRSLARGRMLEAVKTAAVVVTNPTHVAVALRYDADAVISGARHGRPPGRASAAPTVVAKGQGWMADRIRSEARRHGVPVAHQPDLARALYRSVPVGFEIPPELYQAVAEILAFVYRMTGRTGP